MEDIIILKDEEGMRIFIKASDVTDIVEMGNNICEVNTCIATFKIAEPFDEIMKKYIKARIISYKSIMN